MAYLRRILGVTQTDRLHNEDIKKHLHLQKEVNDGIQPMAFEIRQPCYENEWQIPEDSTAWRSARDKVKRKARKMLDRQHKGRLWNLRYDNNTSI